MALPFLPPDVIQSTYTEIDHQSLNLDEATMVDVIKLKKYIQRMWTNQIPANELSIFHQKMATNNGSESYHGRLKSLIKCCKPRIWNFLDTLNEIIIDTDNELARIKEGLQITRKRKKINIDNEERRSKCKEKLIGGSYTPLEYIRAISHTVGSLTNINTDPYSSDDDLIEWTQSSSSENRNLCAVCLRLRETTCVFMPCKHANCCGRCTATIEELGQTCPICRSPIEYTFQIFTN